MKTPKGKGSLKAARYAAGKISYAARKLIEGSFGRLLFFFLLSIALVVLAFGLVFTLIGSGSGFKDPFWFSFLSLLGPDALFAVDEDSIPTRTVASILVALGIIAFNGIIVAIIVARLQQEFEAIREGRGRIFERGHVILLGWTDSTPDLLRGLDNFCVTERRRLLVVATADVSSQELVRFLPRFKRLTVTHRRGLPLDEGFLETIAARNASAIIFQHDKFSGNDPSDPADDPVRDASVATAYIAARAELGDALPSCIVSLRGERRTRAFEPFLNRTSRVFDEDEFVGAYISTLCIEPSVYAALDEMLSFRGSELHFRAAGEDSGMAFHGLSSRYPQALPVGISRHGSLSFAPAPGEIIENEDILVFIAENEIACRRPGRNLPTSIVTPPDNSRLDFIPSSHSLQGRQVLVVGKNRLLPHIMSEFSKAGLHAHPVPAPVRITEGGSEKEYAWASIDGIGQYERVLLLADDSGESRAQTDAETVFRTLSLMRFRDSIDGKFGIAAEFLNPSTERAMRLLPGKGFTWIVGTLVGAELLAMSAIHREHLDAFDDLLSEKGTRILTGILELEKTSRKLTFGEVIVQLGLNRQIVPIGIFRDGEFLLNPPRSSLLGNGAEIAVLAPFDLKGRY